MEIKEKLSVLIYLEGSKSFFFQRTILHTNYFNLQYKAILHLKI